MVSISRPISSKMFQKCDFNMINIAILRKWSSEICVAFVNDNYKKHVLLKKYKYKYKNKYVTELNLKRIFVNKRLSPKQY